MHNVLIFIYLFLYSIFFSVSVFCVSAILVFIVRKHIYIVGFVSETVSVGAKDNITYLKAKTSSVKLNPLELCGVWTSAFRTFLSPGECVKVYNRLRLLHFVNKLYDVFVRLLYIIVMRMTIFISRILDVHMCW